MDSGIAGTRLILASASPARQHHLRAAGVEPEVMHSGVDESGVDDRDPQAMCGTLARLKGEAVVRRLRGEDRGGGSPGGAGRGSGGRAGPEAVVVLGCDSALQLDGEVLGKPDDPADAAARWRRMRGREGTLHTGHHLIRLDTGAADAATADTTVAAAVAATRVRFADVDDAEIDAYVATGEPLRVAGAFTIEGLGAPFVERIDGDHGTVLGLSMPLLRRLLAEVGIRITSLWRSGSSSSNKRGEAAGAASVIAEQPAD